MCWERKNHVLFDGGGFVALAIKLVELNLFDL